MESNNEFPRAVVVRVRPADQVGLAVIVCFESSWKNHFHYMLFVDKDGIGKASREDLLRTFDEERSMFIMDYGDPRVVFNGCITARILTNTQLAAAIDAFEAYRSYCSWPEDYEEKLRSAAARGQFPDRYEIDVHVERGA